MINKFGNQLDNETLQQLKKHHVAFLLLGISLIVLGTLAVLFAYNSTIFSVIYLGIFLIVFGIFEIVQSFNVRAWGNFLLHLLLGILYMVAGIFTILNPTINAITLTLLLALFFVITGVLKIIFSIVKKVPHKGLLALNGIFTLLLGTLIWYQWPVSGLWVIGMLIGIDAIFTGWTLVMISFLAKKVNSSQNHKEDANV